MKRKYWKLNETYLGPFHGLSEEKLKSLKHVATVGGVKCFESAEIPKGTVELYDYGKRVAVITGLGE